MTKKTAAEEPTPFAAAEVRDWLRETGQGAGTRGRLALASHRGYLDSNPERARQIAKEFGLMPKNNQLRDGNLDEVAARMSRPNRTLAVAVAPAKPRTVTVTEEDEAFDDADYDPATT